MPLKEEFDSALTIAGRVANDKDASTDAKALAKKVIHLYQVIFSTTQKDPAEEPEVKPALQGAGAGTNPNLKSAPYKLRPSRRKGL
jgi:hypothetical protein